VLPQRIIVVGASSGGVHALRVLFAGLPATLPVPLVVVLHIGNQPSRLPQLLSAAGALPARHPVDGERLLAGRAFIAPPDHHLLIDGPVLRLTRGPKEHHTRPAIDPTFRSAALSHGPNALGVVLTGGLDDGTAGLQAIKDCGGLAVVQRPDDAEEPSMPLSAMHNVPVDHCVGLANMASLLVKLAHEPPRSQLQPSPRWAHEHDISLEKGDAMEHLEAIAAPSTFVCPDCKGALWQIQGARPLRFICHVGHSYTLNTLQHAQSVATDEALWTAIRSLQEKRLLRERIAKELRLDGDTGQADEAEAEAAALARQERALRQLVEVPLA
jgi:two-component system chemotaxis response regulator CheB